MSALISGSMAFDSIMVFNGRFKEHILPDQIHILNVSFLVPELRREFGGCAGNIAFNLAMLGAECYPLGTVGEDATPYASWFERNGISFDCIKEVSGQLTAQAFITTDLDDNQITAFHPGAMDEAETTSVDAAKHITIGMVSPNAKAAMLKHATEFHERNVPFIFDPGQALPQFDGDELKQCIELATWMTVNDYEWRLTQERTGWGIDTVTERTDALVVTRGGDGSMIYTSAENYTIPAVQPEGVVDPTGCGDAYRAGLLYGLMNGYEWSHAGAIASYMGALKVSHRGTQNHYRNRDQIESNLKAATGFGL